MSNDDINMQGFQGRLQPETLMAKESSLLIWTRTARTAFADYEAYVVCTDIDADCIGQIKLLHTLLKMSMFGEFSNEHANCNCDEIIRNFKLILGQIEENDVWMTCNRTCIESHHQHSCLMSVERC